jgi:hypothetical protein
MQIHCYLFQPTLDKPCRVHSRLDHVFAVTLIWNPYSETRASLSNRVIFTVAVPQSPNLLNSARYHRVFQNFVVPWKIHISQKLILPADASRQDASNGVRVAYVNFYDIWVKNMVKF